MLEIPVFTGEAVCIRLPDVLDEKGKKRPLHTITFPDWIHKVYIDNDNIQEVRGSDLEKGMVLDVNGAVAIVVDIDKKQLYHGQMIPKIQLGCPGDGSVTNKKFKRRFFEDQRIEWELISETPFKNKKANNYVPTDNIIS